MWLQTPHCGPAEALLPCPFLVETPDSHFSERRGHGLYSTNMQCDFGR